MKHNDVFAFLNYTRRKDPIGGSTSVPEYNLVAQRAVFEFFKKVMGLPSQYQKGARDPVEGFGLNMISEEKVRPLKVTGYQLTMSVNGADYPADYFRKAACYTVEDERSITVPFVNDAKFNERRTTVLDPPSATDPVGNLDATVMRFLPDTLNPVYIDYIKYPTSPVMGYVVDYETGEIIYVDRGAYCQVVTPGSNGAHITIAVASVEIGDYFTQTGDTKEDVMRALVININANTLYHKVKAVYDGEKIVLIDGTLSYGGLLTTVSGGLIINKSNSFTDWSVQFDWEDDNEAMNDIIDIMLDNMGISTRDVPIVQWANKEQAK